MATVNDGEQVYAVRYEYVNGRRQVIYMDREIMRAKPGQDVIHLNGDTLDNRVANLLLVPKKPTKRKPTKRVKRCHDRRPGKL